MENSQEKLSYSTNKDNTSNEMLEHMISAHVVLERVKFYCKYCTKTFNLEKDYKFHLLSHNLAESTNNNGRFVKRFKCEKCDAKFVLASTLQAHAAVHEPMPHVCGCGVGFRARADLRAHTGLVHAAEIDRRAATLSFRKERELRNEAWIPRIDYTGLPKPRARPKLRAELVVKAGGRRRTGRPRSKVVQKNGRARRIPLNEDGTVRRFPCDVCGRTYSQAGALSIHRKKHEGAYDFECAYCKKRFVTRAALELHVRTHTGEKPFECPYCGKRFGDPSAFKRHKRTHTGEKPYACSFCGMRFSDASGCIAHERRHMGNKRFTCSKCPAKFYDRSSMDKHYVAVHTCEKKHECEICYKTFALKMYLYVHVKRAHMGTNETFECDYCGYKTSDKHNLTVHIETKHLYPGKFECPECSSRFATKDRLKRHKTIHYSYKKYECDLCCYRSRRKSCLTKHVIKHHLNIKCEACSKSFTCNKDLSDHKLQGCFQCTFCDYKCPSKASLLKHCKRHLHNKKIYICDICNKSFSFKQSLWKHIQWVHGAKKYECDDCAQKFTDRKLLEKHIFSEHLTLVYCNICMKGFTSTMYLDQHKSRGCVIKKFPCEICKKVFTNKCLQSHLNKHGLSKFECHHCSRKFKWKETLKRHLKLVHKHLFKSKKLKKEEIDGKKKCKQTNN